MVKAGASGAHKFYIPVMGTGFTVDTPLKVARYGITSVLSLVDDVLLEQMRAYHSAESGRPYEPIQEDQDDFRAERVSAYLNLVGELVQQQVNDLLASDFGLGSDLNRYFELLPDGSVKTLYERMLASTDNQEQLSLQEELRASIIPGDIEVNIMTKIDRDLYRDGEKLPPEYCEAVASLRGFAKSDLDAAVVFSAGLNPRLYGYINQYDDFLPDDTGHLKKRVILKVSDFRSAQLQGKLLAKKGVWVSEFRIESGLNCGGHSFPTDGRLAGPILEEFLNQRADLAQQNHKHLCKALEAAGRPVPTEPLGMRVTYQGGVGTSEEQEFLLRRYDLDGIGWGTPFLLVPEATNVDDDHLQKLMQARGDDVFLSDSSPFGIPFWNLRTSASEQLRAEEIEAGSPGSSCPKGYLKFNSDYTRVPICTASKTYQKLKLKELGQQSESVSDENRDSLLRLVLAKACLCRDLSGGATKKNGIEPDATPAICPGPGIRFFDRLATLEQMVGHIYGRLSLLADTDRPHVFVQEASLYLDYLRREMERHMTGIMTRKPSYFIDFRNNLSQGLDYYRDLAEEFVKGHRERFSAEIEHLQEQLDLISLQSLETVEVSA